MGQAGTSESPMVKRGLGSAPWEARPGKPALGRLSRPIFAPFLTDSSERLAPDVAFEHHSLSDGGPNQWLSVKITPL